MEILGKVVVKGELFEKDLNWDMHYMMQWVGNKMKRLMKHSFRVLMIILPFVLN